MKRTWLTLRYSSNITTTNAWENHLRRSCVASTTPQTQACASSQSLNGCLRSAKHPSKDTVHKKLLSAPNDA